MQRHKGSASLLLCAMAVSGCAASGKVVKPLPEVCPEPAQAPASLMQSPSYADKLRRILYESEPSATPKSEDSKG